MVTFSKKHHNVTTAAFAAWSLQCHYGITTTSLRTTLRMQQPKTAFSTKVGIPTLPSEFHVEVRFRAFSQRFLYHKPISIERIQQ